MLVSPPLKYNGIIYVAINESLDAIVRGMNVNPTDEILAIGDCGDPAFALLEKAAKVIVVDYNPQQIELIRERTALLKKGDYRGFLNYDYQGSQVEFVRKRNAYFEKKGRLDKIRKKLGGLQINEPEEIQTAALRERFTKAYLSNIFEHVTYDSSLNPEKEIICSIGKNLPLKGLVYVCGTVNDRFKIYFGDFDWLEIDYTLTQIARKLETTKLKCGERDVSWAPVVVRKSKDIDPEEIARFCPNYKEAV